MNVRFWGVRGSIPVPGPATNRYGGNTSCVEIKPRDSSSIVIDAGTGFRHLGKELANGRFGEGQGHMHLLISHTHWDHIQGLPFFSPLYREGNQLHVYARHRDDTHLRAVFASQNAGPYFPVPLTSMRADVRFHELQEGERFEIGLQAYRPEQSTVVARVHCTRLNHPWIAMAYRVEVDGVSVVYASDTAPFTDILLEQEFIAVPPDLGAPLAEDDRVQLQQMRSDLIDLCRDADLCIYDTQFTPEEYRERPHWGHSTPDDAISVAREAGVKHLVLYHHSPQRTDDQQDEILEHCRRAVDGEFVVSAAQEGVDIELEEGTG